jgi:hypothetical protein
VSGIPDLRRKGVWDTASEKSQIGSRAAE